MRLQPVSRSEVRLMGSANHGERYIYCWPASACRKCLWQDHFNRWVNGYEPIEKLFDPLLTQMRKEWERWRDWYQVHGHKTHALGALVVGERLQKDKGPMLPPRISDPAITCENCGIKFFRLQTKPEARPLDHCSDRCIGQSPVGSTARRRRVEHTSRKRAAARAGLTCQYCGKALQAQRGSKRYCSGSCRVGALRVRRHNQR
jgi:hypothetical protein